MPLAGRVVWADVNPWTGNISPDDVARKITARTKAIIAVHWGGCPCDLSRLSRVAGAVPIIEDAALAFGASFGGRRIGSISDFTCFSFQATKHVTTVDGGALTCKTRAILGAGPPSSIVARIDPVQPDSHWDQDIQEAGYKFHMNDVTAAIGLEQLKHTESVLAAHRAHAAAYGRALQNNPTIRPLRLDSDGLGSFWTYTVRVAPRAEFISYMIESGIRVSRVFVRNDRYRALPASRRRCRA